MELTPRTVDDINTVIENSKALLGERNHVVTLIHQIQDDVKKAPDDAEMKASVGWIFLNLSMPNIPLHRQDVADFLKRTSEALHKGRGQDLAKVAGEVLETFAI